MFAKLQCKGFTLNFFLIITILYGVSSCKMDDSYSSAPAETPFPFDNGFTNKLTPFLDWEDLGFMDSKNTYKPASGYHIQVNTKSDFTGAEIVNDASLTISEYQVPSELTINKNYYWRVRAATGGDVWADWSKAWSFMVVAFNVGDIGPAGGIIFYDDEEDDIDNIEGILYLEVAPQETEWESVLWGEYGTDISGADGYGIGKGKQNTIDILDYVGIGSTYAAQLCDGLSYNGYSDWFLPSISELALVYDNLFLQGLGEFSSYHMYWSSTEEDNELAWRKYFAPCGGQNLGLKNDTSHIYKVRAIRAF